MTITCDICKQEKSSHGFKSVWSTQEKRVITYCPDCSSGSFQQGVVGIDDGRKQDILDITSKLQTTKDPKQKAYLQNTLIKIKNEPRKVREMRHELIKQMRQGNADNVQDINRWVEKRSDFR